LALFAPDLARKLADNKTQLWTHQTDTTLTTTGIQKGWSHFKSCLMLGCSHCRGSNDHPIQ